MVVDVTLYPGATVKMVHSQCVSTMRNNMNSWKLITRMPSYYRQMWDRYGTGCTETASVQNNLE